MRQLEEIVRGKRVLLLCSTTKDPDSLLPKGRLIASYDIVARCNDWWAWDEGRCDVLFHIGSCPKIKSAWLFSQKHLQEQLKLLCLFKGGGETKYIKRLCGFWRTPIMEYEHKSKWLESIQKYFALRGGTPSTGLNAAFMLGLCEPRELHITAADLYSSEPKHVGWHRHLPLAHCHWYRKLEQHGATLGPDLKKGIDYWEGQDEDNNSK
jgi:hypothetical protein